MTIQSQFFEILKSFQIFNLLSINLQFEKLCMFSAKTRCFNIFQNFHGAIPSAIAHSQQ